MFKFITAFLTPVVLARESDEYLEVERKVIAYGYTID